MVGVGIDGGFFSWAFSSVFLIRHLFLYLPLTQIVEIHFNNILCVCELVFMAHQFTQI